MPKYTAKRTENIHPHKHLFMEVRSTIIQHSPKVETTEMPTK